MDNSSDIDGVDAHMVGFEKEVELRNLYAHPDVQSRLFKWADFMAVAKVLNPTLCHGAFSRRPCRRRLRYLGEAAVHGEQEAEESGPFKVDEIYLSVDFTGGIYTIEGYDDHPIGCAYWEVVTDQCSDQDR